MRSYFKAIIILAATVGFHRAEAQTSPYKSHIKDLYKAINTHLKDSKSDLYIETTDPAKNEHPHSYLWPLCAYIQAANEMEVLEPQKSYMLPVEKAIAQYYRPGVPYPAYQDYVVKEKTTTLYYDDNQWIAIAFMDAYKRKHDKKYIDTTKMIYRFMLGGLDTVAGGGIYWREKDKTTKNTCSNGPGVLVALQLYKATKNKKYLQTALDIYNWTQKHLQAPEGVYYDNIKLPSMELAKAAYTYNTGTMLQSAALLYNITKDKKYLAEAQRVAKAGKAHFFKNGRLPNEYWFNAVMLRGYVELYKIDKNREWIDFFRQDADQIWEKERDANNLVGNRPEKRLIDQGAMIEIYAVLEQVKNIK
ncbi:AGE family epimerase/isomerase [Mucilaginibacter sp. Bleaf8]|uniref:glycoside hydrolase family 76 protein n=1 Tax=Mucilaginibacter sp. Bleaf8 TaxID=2834430 RepID=UPI001BCD339D|nr:glycoside hydrolase family 76 protein [Mucilaginibacter sp. Bleaf8]MBS7564090.1 AGE family epimerase/isomerase [Mucilaginibacter sp. Bleaf8]